MFRHKQDGGPGDVDVSSFWIPYSDLMAALLGIFALLLIVTIYNLGAPLNEVKTQLEERAAIIERLRERIGKDHGVDVTGSGAIRLEGKVLFDFNKAELKDEGKVTLLKFMPEYLEAMSSSEMFKRHLARILIEGHADPTSASSDSLKAYLGNLDLSQKRAASVVKFLLESEELNEYRSFMKQYFLASGRSSTDPVYDEKTHKINNERSRRIQIEFLMNDTELVEKLIESVDYGNRANNE